MIQEMRAQLITDLEPLGVPVHEPYPDRISAPCAIIGFPSGDYLTAGQFDGEIKVQVRVILVAGRGANRLAQLEDMIETTLRNVLGDWGLKGVSEPGTLKDGSMEFLASDVTLEKQGSL